MHRLCHLVHVQSNFQVLYEHLDSAFISIFKGNDDVCKLHGWLDEVVIGRLYKTIVLS